MRLHLSLAATALAICMTGCAANAATLTGSTSASQSRSPSATGTIVGTFRIIGGPYPGINRPLSGTITIHTGSETGRVVATTTAKKGHFTVTVSPGRYVAVGYSGSGGSLRCTSGQAKHVGADKTVHVAVQCDVP